MGWAGVLWERWAQKKDLATAAVADAGPSPGLSAPESQVLWGPREVHREPHVHGWLTAPPRARGWLDGSNEAPRCPEGRL